MFSLEATRLEKWCDNNVSFDMFGLLNKVANNRCKWETFCAQTSKATPGHTRLDMTQTPSWKSANYLITTETKTMSQEELRGMHERERNLRRAFFGPLREAKRLERMGLKAISQSKRCKPREERKRQNLLREALSLQEKCTCARRGGNWGKTI